MKRLIAPLLLIIILSGCAWQRPYKESRLSMGTIWEVAIYAKDQSAAKEAAGAAFDEIQRLDNLMSKYNSQSELFRVNTQAPLGPVRISPELLALIEDSLEYSKLTRGAFDITIGPLMRAWGFSKKEGRVPSGEELKGILNSVGYDKVKLDAEEGTVYFTRPGVELDLGGIAKGYGVDRAIEVLKEHGMSSCLVNAGGNMYCLGSPPGMRSWQIGVKDPRNPDKILKVLKLKDQAVATSGDYENYFMLEGKRYSHIIDPRTGRPVLGMRSATIIARSATEADALSTAVFVMGKKAGLELVQALEDTEAIVVTE